MKDAAKTYLEILPGFAAIGLSTSFGDFKKAGLSPMLHGFTISALVVVVALGVEWCMGLV